MNFLNTFLVLFTSYVSVVYGVCNTLPVVENSDSNVTAPGPYAEETVAQFNCSVGFSPSGNRVYTCSGSSWVGGSYQCDPIYCGHVETPRYGYLLEQPTYEIGSFIKFGCDDGYTMNGRSQLVCRVDGEWNPREAPVCVIKDCGEFGSVAHGTTFQDNTHTERNKYGSKVEVTCDRGYIIHGSPEVACDKNGIWGTKPTCTAVKCEHYPGLNSSCVAKSDFDGRFLFMPCKDAISSDVGPSYVKCENNKWDPHPDDNLMACYCDCKVDVDDAIMDVSNLINGYLKHDNELIWRCKNNGHKSTNQPIKCLDGKMTKPVCIQPVTTTKPYIPTGTPPTGVVVNTTGGNETNTSNLEKESQSNITNTTGGNETNTSNLEKESQSNIKTIYIVVIVSATTGATGGSIAGTIMIYKKIQEKKMTRSNSMPEISMPEMLSPSGNNKEDLPLNSAPEVTCTCDKNCEVCLLMKTQKNMCAFV